MGTSPTALPTHDSGIIPDDAKDGIQLYGYEPHRNMQRTHDSGNIPDVAETMGISPTALQKVSDSG